MSKPSGQSPYYKSNLPQRPFGDNYIMNMLNRMRTLWKSFQRVHYDTHFRKEYIMYLPWAEVVFAGPPFSLLYFLPCLLSNSGKNVKFTGIRGSPQTDNNYENMLLDKNMIFLLLLVEPSHKDYSSLNRILWSSHPLKQ